MMIKTLLTAIALACVGASASAAANVHAWTDTSYGLTSDNTDLGPFESYHIVTLTNPGGTGAPATFDDDWTFTLTSASDLASYAATWQVADTDVTAATFALYSGTPGAGTEVFSSAVSNAGDSFLNNDLAAGNYYFEISGTYTTKYAFYDIDATANPSAPPLAVPEPANVALMLAGLGMMGLMAKRRKQA